MIRVLGTTSDDIGKLVLAAIVFAGGFFLAGIVHNLIHEWIKNEWLSIAISLCVGAVTVHRLLIWALRQAKDYPPDQSQ